MNDIVTILDSRSFHKTIEKYAEEVNSRPIEPSVILAAKSTSERQHKYYSDLRALATVEELPLVDAKLTEIEVRLRKYEIELSSYEANAAPCVAREQTVNGGKPAPESVGLRPLLEEILADRMKKQAINKSVALDGWLREYGLKRTAVMYYRARTIRGKIGKNKYEAIEAAILASARLLGLMPRTNLAEPGTPDHLS